MPLVQVDLPQPVFAEKGARISDEIHQAFIDALAIPADDKFQIFRPREVGELVFDPGYGGVDRRSLIVIQVLMVHMYPVERKRELYRHIVTRLSALGIRREDIQIAVTENGYEDWYAGRLHGE
jgi:phenylpyruvate tautomerase PptA (4-oxalocrotonate tautomerase family)